ncbi:MAG: hypothetical protein LBP64_03295 [Tannerella sp.]|jgi:hypothetical protein|nr:hypothetical protein [Tannerella sp.]
MNIKQLLDKFYAGDTTPEEECRLADYFLNCECADENLKKDQAMFRALCGKRHRTPLGVSVRLQATLRRLDESERRTPRTHAMWWYRVAAVSAIAILCTGLFFATRTHSPHTVADTCDRPEDAALVAEQTLLYVSAKLNRGIEQTRMAEEELIKMNDVLEKTFNTTIQLYTK